MTAPEHSVESFKDIDVDNIMDDVVQSGCLGESQRQKKLLRYLLEEFKAGRSNKVKGYIIAIDVFGRPQDFDDSIDSIVRVEMHRLRKNLKQHNLSGYKYEITIPRRKFAPKICIVEKQKPHWAPKKMIFTVLALVIILASLLFFSLQNLKSNDDKSEAYMNGLFPVVGIEVINSDFSEGETREFVLELISLVSNPGIVLFFETNENETNKDFAIGLSLNKVDGDVIISVTPLLKGSTAGKKKQFEFKSADNIPKYADKMIGDWVTNPENEMLRFYARSGNRSPEILITFQCILDVHRFYANDALKFGGNERLYKCIDDFQTENIYEQMELSYHRGLLLNHQIRGRIDFEIENPELQYDEIVDSMKTAHANNALVYELMISRVQRTQPLDKQELKRLLFEKYTKFELSSTELSNLSIQFGLILGDWEQAMEILDQYFEDVGRAEKRIGYYVEASYGIAHLDFEQARVSYDRIPDLESYQVNIMGLTIGCHLGDETLITDTVSSLTRLGLGRWDDYFDRINGSNLDKGLKEILTSSKVVKPCFIAAQLQ